MAQGTAFRCAARVLVPGVATGPLLHATTGLSFWGGVDPTTGTIIDRHHPLSGRQAAGAVLAIPSGRGSCTASGVLIEALVNGVAPAAIILCEAETILPLGALLAQEVFDRSLPIVAISPEAHEHLGRFRHVAIGQGVVEAAHQPLNCPVMGPRVDPLPTTVHLDAADRAMLEGAAGAAVALAMRILVRMAHLSGATALLPVTQAHLDCCIYLGPTSIRLAEHFRDLGGRVRVPTTLNAISADLRPGHGAAAPQPLAAASARQIAAFLAMGATESYTCAPYLLDRPPAAGDHIGWSESNAVVFANSVLAARTQKYPDYLDLCIALTGRAPAAGCHLEHERRATVAIRIEAPEAIDDSFWPLLGYACGKLSPHAIPAITGVAGLTPTADDLKAFAAAFATTSAAPMLHLVGITPEAADLAAATGGRAVPERALDHAALRQAWLDLNRGTDRIGLVALGNPHLSLTEIGALAALSAGRRMHPDVRCVVTSSRAMLEAATAQGFVAPLEAFGVRFVADTCWCMLGPPVVGPAIGTVMTNSAKYAHYGPGLTGAAFRFGSRAACVEAACLGAAPAGLPPWLLP